MVTTIKSNHTVVTKDHWRLHLVRTQTVAGATTGSRGGRLLPVILIPGLCSSGTFCFDLSPAVSLADWLAEQGWDVWTAELRGNGLSDKPGLFSARSHYWTIDDLVDMDIPAVMTYVCMESGCTAAHCIGHSMGGMILTAAMARGDATTERMRSVTIVGSSCFLEGSWWAVFEPTLPAVRLLHSVPAGTTLRLYSQLAFTRLGVRAVDVLYFWPTNTDPALARVLLARNFSATSPGVILQLRSAFKPYGLCAANTNKPFADPAHLGSVRTPVMFICGDKDKMCPPQGAAKQYDMCVGSLDRKLIILGPPPGKSGRTPKAVANPKGQPNTFTEQHYGHFDILMGKRVVVEVFPRLHEWLLKHDTTTSATSSTVAQPAMPSPSPSPCPAHAAPSPQVGTASAPTLEMATASVSQPATITSPPLLTHSGAMQPARAADTQQRPLQLQQCSQTLHRQGCPTESGLSYAHPHEFGRSAEAWMRAVALELQAATQAFAGTPLSGGLTRSPCTAKGSRSFFADGVEQQEEMDGREERVAVNSGALSLLARSRL